MATTCFQVYSIPFRYCCQILMRIPHPLKNLNFLLNAFKGEHCAQADTPSVSPQKPLHQLLQTVATNASSDSSPPPAHLIPLLDTWISTLCDTAPNLEQALTQLLAFLAHPSTQYSLIPLILEPSSTFELNQLPALGAPFDWDTAPSTPSRPYGPSRQIQITGIYIANSSRHPKPQLITTPTNEHKNAALIASIQATYAPPTSPSPAWAICYQLVPTTLKERLTFPQHTFWFIPPSIFRSPEPFYAIAHLPLNPSLFSQPVPPARFCSLQATNTSCSQNPPVLPPELSLPLDLPFLPENTALHLQPTPRTTLPYSENTYPCPAANPAKLLQFLQSTTHCPFDTPLSSKISSDLLNLQVRYCLNHHTASTECSLIFHVIAPFPAHTKLPDFQYYLSVSYEGSPNASLIHAEIQYQFTQFIHAYLTMCTLRPAMSEFRVQPFDASSDIDPLPARSSIRLPPYTKYTLQYAPPYLETSELKLFMEFFCFSTLRLQSDAFQHSAMRLKTPSRTYTYTPATQPSLQQAVQFFAPILDQEVLTNQINDFFC